MSSRKEVGRLTQIVEFLLIDLERLKKDSTPLDVVSEAAKTEAMPSIPHTKAALHVADHLLSTDFKILPESVTDSSGVPSRAIHQAFCINEKSSGNGKCTSDGNTDLAPSNSLSASLLSSSLPQFSAGDYLAGDYSKQPVNGSQTALNEGKITQIGTDYGSASAKVNLEKGAQLDSSILHTMSCDFNGGSSTVASAAHLCTPRGTLIVHEDVTQESQIYSWNNFNRKDLRLPVDLYSSKHSIFIHPFLTLSSWCMYIAFLNDLCS